MEQGLATGEIAPAVMPTDHYTENEDEEHRQPVRNQCDATGQRAFATGQRDQLEEAKKEISLIDRRTNEQIERHTERKRSGSRAHNTKFKRRG